MSCTTATIRALRSPELCQLICEQVGSNDRKTQQSTSNRLGLLEDVAPLVAFLSSPAVQWINGQNIRVNGVSLICFFVMHTRF